MHRNDLLDRLWLLVLGIRLKKLHLLLLLLKRTCIGRLRDLVMAPFTNSCPQLWNPFASWDKWRFASSTT